MFQVRNALAEYAVLPLGCGSLKAKLEDKVTNVKALMLYGPPGSGKKMLVEAVCSELGAMLVNISPDRLAGLYQGKQGPTKLMHLIFKVAAESEGGGSNPQAPVVVYMDDCERFFEAGGGKKAAKVKVDKAGPIRFKKDLLNYLKVAYRPPDRVIFIGTTRAPEKADKKDLKAFFDKFLYVPYPDYPARLELWKSFCDKQFREGGEGVPRELPASFDLYLTTLARISEGFTAGEVEKVVKRTVTASRLSRLEARPLEGSEFLNHLALEATRIQAAAKALPKPLKEVYGEFTSTITGFADREKKIAELSDPDKAGGEDKKKAGKKKK
jgi:SpoVK/Ycf46/Vps4 family AAA+-type ATPase